MTFLAPLALLIGLSIALPIIAHALRKGQSAPVVFPPAKRVPPRTASARKRHRLEDPLLLALRVLLLLCLALLAASPFVQCSRLSLSRTDGASVSAVLVIDDSASMRVRTESGESRLRQAIDAGTDLLNTARSGDSFAIVLSGSPARVLTPPTTELSSVKEALETISATDRKTDLSGALSLARNLQSEALQKDRPLVLLSDLATDELSSLDLTAVVFPKEELGQPYENCALLSSLRGADAVHVEVGCTSEAASKDRVLTLHRHNEEDLEEPLTEAVAARDGAVRIPLPKEPTPAQRDALSSEHLVVRLSPAKEEGLDQIPEDDEVELLKTTSALTIALRADRGKDGRKTGSSTLLQAALEALEHEIRVETLNLLPDRSSELSSYGALLIDDPSGFTPEVSDALSEWVQHGGVAVVLLGPSVERAPLGSNFHPFLNSPPTWKATESSGVDPNQAAALGPLTSTWKDLDARFRANLGAEEGALVKAQWADGAPLVLERLLGRGLLLAVTLPSSADESDLALRPAFLELLDYAVSESEVRRGAMATDVGLRWRVDPAARVKGPDGFELLKSRKSEDQSSAPIVTVEPTLAGRYVISDTDSKGAPTRQLRYATRDLREHVRQPGEFSADGGFAESGSALTKVGISREIALLCLILGVLELIFRLIRRPIRARSLRASET